MVSNKTLIKKNNSKKSTKSAKRCDSKQFCALQNVLENAFFFFKNLSQGNFLHCPRFFILTKILNTAHTPTEMKQNLLHRIFPSQDFR